MTYNIVPLQSSHNKKFFSCGKFLLDVYIHKQAKQDVKRKLSVCFVLADEENNIKGYYTLSSNSIPRVELPDYIIKQLPPSYEFLPVTLLGRLAIDKSLIGKGWGSILLIDALKKSYEVSTRQIGSIAVVVDPIDDEAVTFYKKYGFIPLLDSGKMFLPMKSIQQLLT